MILDMSIRLCREIADAHDLLLHECVLSTTETDGKKKLAWRFMVSYKWSYK